MEVPQKTKNNYYMIQQCHSWAYIQRNVSQDTIKTLAHSCLLQYYSQKPTYGNSSDALQLMNVSKCDIYIYIHIYI
jgi:hypothetical protein